MSIQVDTTRFQEALDHLVGGDAMSSLNALLRSCKEYDRCLLQQFRSRACEVSLEEIKGFSELECWSLVHAISRQLYWDEPPVFSVNNVLVDIPDTPFRFGKQINGLVRRLDTLLNVDKS